MIDRSSEHAKRVSAFLRSLIFLKEDKALVPLLALIVVVCSIGTAICGIGLTSYSFDSWVFYDISLNIFDDFYKVWTYRSYFTPLPYSAAAPPVYPAAIAIANRLLGLGAACGLLINILAVAGLTWCNSEITKTLTGRRSDGLVLTLAVLCFLPFANEIYGARTHPLAITIFALLFLIVIRTERPVLRTGVSLGLLSGVAAMTRFDWLLPSLILGGLLAWWSRATKVTIVYLFCLILVMLPWVAYSLFKFGIIYASDSSWVTAAAPGWWPTDYFVPPGPPPITGAAGLIAKLRGNLSVLSELAFDLARHVAPLVVGVVVGCIGYVVVFRTPPRFEPSPLPLAVRRSFTLLLIWSGVIFSAWMSGYASIRYLSGLVWQSVIISGCIFSLWLSPASARTRDQCSIIFGISFAAVAVGLNIYLSLGGGHGTSREIVFRRSEQLARCLLAAGGGPDQTVLFVDEELFPVEFGPIAKWLSAVPPRNLPNLSRKEIGGLIRRFRVGFVAGERGEKLNSLAPYLRSDAVVGCPIIVHAVHLV